MISDYIPKKDSAFFNFQRVLSETVQPKLAAWNISATAFNNLQTARTLYETAYSKNTNKATRTRTDVTTHRKQREAYTKVIRSFVKEQVAGNTAIPNSARVGMMLKPLNEKKGKRSGIEGSPWVTAQTMAGCWIRMDVRRETDSNRSSMHPLADVIEVIYMIGTTQPTSRAQCNKTIFSSKAKFIIKVDMEHAGNKIYGYVRWKNIRDDNKSGSWSSLFQARIAE